MAGSPSMQLGTVYLVGAGPGDPGLITWRAIQCLQQADVVLYDYLANAQLLRWLRHDAERICLGRHGQSRIWTQDEIHERMVTEARRGRQVVRLQGGDPAVFGRLAEEVSALEEAGIPLEVVPGITAALAVASYTGIPLTHRDWASAVALVTGQENPEKHGAGLDYAALARFPGTLVFYMGVTTVAHWSRRLMDEGMSPETPVAVVRRCSLPDQVTLRSSLASVAKQVAEARLRPPVLFLVGPVAALRPQGNWFESRPLWGVSVLVTRPHGQADSMADRLMERGARVPVQPAIIISAPADWRPVDAALERLAEFSWIVFSSANGVRFFLDRLLERGGDLRRLATSRLAVIGPATAAELERYHLRADLSPPEYRAESLAESLAERTAGCRVLLVRASRGREVLAERLGEAGADVEQVVAYASTDVPAADPSILDEFDQRRIDWVTVTSSAIARSVVRLFGDRLHHSRLASISPVTSGTLRSLGFEPAVEADSYTTEGLVEAIVAAK